MRSHHFGPLVRWSVCWVFSVFTPSKYLFIDGVAVMEANFWFADLRACGVRTVIHRISGGIRRRASCSFMDHVVD